MSSDARAVEVGMEKDDSGIVPLGLSTGSSDGGMFCVGDENCLWVMLSSLELIPSTCS